MGSTIEQTSHSAGHCIRVLPSGSLGKIVVILEAVAVGFLQVATEEHILAEKGLLTSTVP